jgi:hypothetical protein
MRILERLKIADNLQEMQGVRRRYLYLSPTNELGILDERHPTVTIKSRLNFERIV